MTLQDKNKDNKKYMFKEGSNPLFPISNKSPNPLKNYSAVKLNIKIDLKKKNKKLSSNYLNTNPNSKKILENSAFKNYKEINKTYLSSRKKDENPIINANLSKIKPLNFTKNINNSGILEKYQNLTNTRKANFSANKQKNKSDINLEINSSDYNNFNFLSPKNNRNPNFLDNNNIYSVRKPVNNKNKNFIEINNINSNSYYNNIIINNNSFTQKNSDIQPKIDKNNRGIKTPKESNVKLIFNNKRICEKKPDDTPIILKRKDSSSLPLTNTNTGNNLKISIDKNIFNGEYKLHLKKSIRNFSNQKNIINNYIKSDKKITLEKNKKKKINGPEDLHFFYIQGIQEGKLNEREFDKD